MSTIKILFRMGEVHPTSFPPITSTNVGIKNQNFLILILMLLPFLIFRKWYIQKMPGCSTEVSLKKTFIVPFYGWCLTASRLQSHFKNTVYFFPFSFQNFLVLIWLTSETKKDENQPWSNPMVLGLKTLD